MIVLNIQTGTPSNPSEALENVGIVVLVGPILADTDVAVKEMVVVVVGGGDKLPVTSWVQIRNHKDHLLFLSGVGIAVNCSDTLLRCVLIAERRVGLLALDTRQTATSQDHWDLACLIYSTLITAFENLTQSSG